ncbi:hypothetical protein HOP50_05g36890 [Chloropicon primus]|nr:hypothetical protein HOP50_05g36890 [Chloropicon primus]
MTALTPSDVAKLLSSPLQGLKIFLKGRNSEEKSSKTNGKVLTRDFSPTRQVDDDLLMENPAASERVPLLGSPASPLLEEGMKMKAKKGSGEGGKGRSLWSAEPAPSSLYNVNGRKYGVWFFVCLFALAGLAFSTSLVVGNIAHNLLKLEMEEDQNRRVVLSSLVGVAAGTGSTAMSMKYFAKSYVCTCVCSASFAFGALVPVFPWLVNVFFLGLALNLVHQIATMAALVACCIYACGTYLEFVLARETPTFSRFFHPLLTGLKHLFYAAFMVGLTLCLGSGINNDWSL